MNSLTTQPQEAFVQSVDNVVQVSQREGFGIAFVGSIARAAFTREPVEIIRDNGSLRDIDIMLLPGQDIPNTNQLTQAGKPFKVDLVYQGCIEVGKGGTTLKYKSIKVPVDPQVFNIEWHEFQGVHIPTYNPTTLQHLLLLYGQFRQKDRMHARKLERVRAEYDKSLPEELFRPFHTFDELRRQKYPFDQSVLRSVKFCWTRIPQPLREFLLPAVGPVRQLVTRTELPNAFPPTYWED